MNWVRLWAVLCCGCSCAAWAQVVPEREVEIVQALYDAGKYAEAAQRANESLALTNFADAQRIKLHEIAGLSAFNLGDSKAAQNAFLQLLRVNPDYILDPFAVPPSAIKVFDQVRKEHTDALNLVRQQITIRIEQEKRAAVERQRLQAEEATRQRQADMLTNGLVVRTVEKRLMLVNFVPFGAGQFQQGRIGWGVTFAASEGLTAVLSIVSFFAIEAMYRDVTRVWTDRLTADGKGVFSVTTREIPSDRQSEYAVWNALKFGTGIAFYALWALGIGDALWRHQDEVITERKETPAPKSPSARLNIYPTPGGVGAGVTIGF